MKPENSRFLRFGSEGGQKVGIIITPKLFFFKKSEKEKAGAPLVTHALARICLVLEQRKGKL